MAKTSEGLGPAAQAAIEAALCSLGSTEREEPAQYESGRLADEAGVAWTTLSRWRRGENAPSPESALKLARACEERALRLLKAAAALEAAARREEVESA